MASHTMAPPGAPQTGAWSEGLALPAEAVPALEHINTALAALEPLPESLRQETTKHLREMLEHLAGHGQGHLLNLPNVAGGLVRLAFAAPFLVRHLKARHGPALENLLTMLEGALPGAWPAPDPGRAWITGPLHLAQEDEMMRWLRIWKYDAYLVLTLRALLGLDAPRATCGAISALAVSLLRAAFQAALVQGVEKFGLPLRRDGSMGAMCVIGMGKLGGGELNYASDVDVIMLQDGDHQSVRRITPPEDWAAAWTAPGGWLEPGGDAAFWAALDELGGAVRSGALASEEGRVSGGEFHMRVARAAIRLLGTATAEGIAFRVDTDLRPQGSAGLLVPTLGAMENYYQEMGREWERTAMIKARVIAGQEALGNAFHAMIQPFVYRRYLDYSALEGIAIVKEDINRAHSAVLDSNIKLGAGGIRENEFLVQAMQLLHGGKRPALRVTGHHQAVDRLRAEKLLEAADADAVLEDYWALRAVENRIQMVGEEQTHDLPEHTEDRLRVLHDFQPGFATRMEGALEAMGAVRGRIGARFDQLTTGMGDQEFTATETWREAVRANVPPDQADECMARVDDLYKRLMDTRMGERCVFKLGRLLTNPLVYRQGMQGAFPKWLRFMEQIGNRNALYTLMEAHPPVVPWVSLLFAEGGRHADPLIRHPEFMESFLATGDDWAALNHQMDDLLASTPDEEMFLLELQQIKALWFIRALTAYLHHDGAVADGVDVNHHHLLSLLADATITASARQAWRLTVERHGQPSAGEGELAGFAVMAMGKLGSRETRFGSDLDLIFVYREEGETSSGRSHSRFYTRLAQKIGNLLTAPTQFGQLYELDHRLRPFGGKGLLAPSLSAFRNYLEGGGEGGAEVWNFQAFTRLRFVCGDVTLGEDLEQAIAEAWTRRGAAGLDCPTVVAKVREMLERLVAENGTAADSGAPSLKYGLGGMIGAEFLQQAHFLCAHLHQGGRWTAPPPHEIMEAVLPGYQVLNRLDERLSFHGHDWRHVPTPEQLQALGARGLPDDMEALQGLCRKMAESVEAGFSSLVNG